MTPGVGVCVCRWGVPQASASCPSASVGRVSVAALRVVCAGCCGWRATVMGVMLACALECDEDVIGIERLEMMVE